MSKHLIVVGGEILLETFRLIKIRSIIILKKDPPKINPYVLDLIEAEQWITTFSGESIEETNIFSFDKFQFKTLFIDEIRWLRLQSKPVDLDILVDFYETYDYTNSTRKHYAVQTVRGLKSNQLGLYDMSGNVYEWS